MQSIIISYLFVFLLYLSMNAGNARTLRVVDKASSLEFINVSDKVESIERGKTNGDNSKAALSQLDMIKYTRREIPVKRLSSVSRRMPLKNHNEHPGYYADYSRPRTRPPSHN